MQPQKDNHQHNQQHLFSYQQDFKQQQNEQTQIISKKQTFDQYTDIKKYNNIQRNQLNNKIDEINNNVNVIHVKPSNNEEKQEITVSNDNAIEIHRQNNNKLNQIKQNLKKENQNPINNKQKNQFYIISSDQNQEINQNYHNQNDSVKLDIQMQSSRRQLTGDRKKQQNQKNNIRKNKVIKLITQKQEQILQKQLKVTGKMRRNQSQKQQKQIKQKQIYYDRRNYSDQNNQYEYEEQKEQTQSQPQSDENDNLIQQQQYFHQVNQPQHPLSNQPSKNTVVLFKSNSYYTLINAQIPKGNFVNIIIKRVRNKASYFQTQVKYQCFLLQDKKYLISVIKNKFFKATSHYKFYKDSRSRNKFTDISPQNQYAYLDSNISGTGYVFRSVVKYECDSEKSTAIDGSQMIKRMDESSEVISVEQGQKTNIFKDDQINLNMDKHVQMKQTCYFGFKINFFGLAGQRQVKILKKKNKKLKKANTFSDLKAAQDNRENDKYFQFSTKTAVKGKNGLQLDFKGKVKMQSTKNLMIQNEKGEDVLIFGKIKEDIYCCSIGNPLCIIEGLGFAIANLDRKLFIL